MQLLKPEPIGKKAIEVVDLVKTYSKDVVAIDHANFSVEQGEIFGFLGLNGAGKTTTIKILSTLIPPTSGKVRVLDFDVLKDGIEIRRRIGVVQQKESYDRNLTVRASLSVYSSLWGLRKEEAAHRIDFLFEKFGLKELKERKIRWLSFGQRRRLQVAREFLHDSSLLILDEPTSGLDVLARHSFLDFCRERARGDGQTIFFTTHIVSEAEYLCDRIAVIHKGRIIAVDTPKELKKNYGGMKSVSIVLRDYSDVAGVQKLAETMSGVQRIEQVSESSEVRIASAEPFGLASDLSHALESSGYETESISIKEPSLEDVVVKLVGEAA